MPIKHHKNLWRRNYGLAFECGCTVGLKLFQKINQNQFYYTYCIDGWSLFCECGVVIKHFWIILTHHSSFCVMSINCSRESIQIVSKVDLTTSSLLNKLIIYGATCYTKVRRIYNNNTFYYAWRLSTTNKLSIQCLSLSCDANSTTVNA